MTPGEWVAVCWFALNALIKVGIVGKRRPPITPGIAVWELVVYALLTWLVVTL